jgi:hypothetical protein
MVYFQTKNPNLGKFWRVLQWTMLVCNGYVVVYCHLKYFVAICTSYFMVIWYMFTQFGMLYQEKSGNPAPDSHGDNPTIEIKSVASLEDELDLN